MSARLAEAGMNVLVLERGPWWGPGGAQQDRKISRRFPRGLAHMGGFLRGLTRTDERGDRVLWSHPTGLFDVHMWPGVTAVAASGVGGGSLVYAGAQSHPMKGFFDEHYPADISDDEMTPYFEKVEAVQQPQPLPYPVASRPTFDEGLRRAGLGPAEAPILAIQFGDPHRPEIRANAMGYPQQTFQACGDSVLGCEHGSKSTLDITYLLAARRSGADIRALCEVTGIGGEDGRYEVLWHDHASGTDHLVVTPRLILAAGAIGTLRLLFAARDRHRSLRNLPPALGAKFSGNGDYLAMLYRASVPPHNGRHAMIQSVCDLDDGSWVGEAAPPINQLPMPGPVRRRLAESVILLSTGPEPVTRLHSAKGAPFAPPYKEANAEFYARAAKRLQTIAEPYRPAPPRQRLRAPPRRRRQGPRPRRVAARLLPRGAHPDPGLPRRDHRRGTGPRRRHRLGPAGHRGRAAGQHPRRLRPAPRPGRLPARYRRRHDVMTGRRASATGTRTPVPL